MQKAKAGSCWYFVDESGDPNFYDHRKRFIVGKPGASKVLILGLVETTNPEYIRHALRRLQHEIVNDPRFAGVPSLEKTRVAFHAKDDLPAIRDRVFEVLEKLDFKAHFAVARKTAPVFHNIFQGSPNAFYDHLVSYTFEKILHRYQDNYIYIAQRGNRERQQPLQSAVIRARQWFHKNCGGPTDTEVYMRVQQANREPCLSVIDYLNWAVYRAYTCGEMDYYRSIEEKVSLLVDLYNEPRCWFNRRRRFDITKVMPL